MRKSFKEGQRVYMDGKGYGTVMGDTYKTIHHTTRTSVKWDDYLGQKCALAEDTEELREAK